MEILLKRGRNSNEMTRYRYDVILHVGDPKLPRSEIPTLRWTALGISICWNDGYAKNNPKRLKWWGFPTRGYEQTSCLGSTWPKPEGLLASSDSESRQFRASIRKHCGG